MHKIVRSRNIYHSTPMSTFSATVTESQFFRLRERVQGAARISSRQKYLHKPRAAMLFAVTHIL